MKRSYNWDLLRSISMFLVVVVHTTSYLGTFGGVDVGNIVGTAANVCNGVFFALSGYFALGPQKRSITDNYLNKLVTIILPLFLYVILLYLTTPQVSGRSIRGFVSYFLALMNGKWWFVPTLVPCLVAAPFIARGFQTLSDRTVRQLCVVMCALFAVGAVCLFGKWGFGALGKRTLSNLFALPTSIVPAGILSSGTAYFQLFILGGIYRRLAASIDRSLSNKIIIVGAVCWIIDVAFTAFGVARVDPSYYWLFTTLAAFVLFERITIHGPISQKCFEWTAKRSYTIYLLQGTIIPLIAEFLYKQSPFGNINDMNVGSRIGFWIALIIASYAVSLAFASLFDTIALTPIQNAARKLISHTRERRMKLRSEG